MRQRVARLGGSLEIESEPGLGTAISASVPAISPDDDPGTGTPDDLDDRLGDHLRMVRK